MKALRAVVIYIAIALAIALLFNAVYLGTVKVTSSF
jgi:hypothetical protein